MTKQDYNRYAKMYSVPAGAILNHLIGRQDKSKAEIARLSNLIPQRLNDLINGTFVDKEDKELLKAVMYYSETSTCKIFRGKSTISLNEKVLCTIRLKQQSVYRVEAIEKEEQLI